jgi:PKHD-type hydroxylase
MLLHIPNVLDHAQLMRMRAALEDADWADGRETVGPQGARAKRNEQLPDASPLRTALGREVLDALARHPLFHAAVLPQRVLPPRFNRYGGGGHYGSHVDGAVMALPDGSQLRTDVSCTLFLSDPEAYEGGELVINDLYGEHEVKLPAGDAIVYPSGSLHRVQPVTRGARLGAFLWAQSLVRDDGQRQLLLELDTAIRQLADGGADAGALLQLSGVYHNLLRRWSET